MSNFKGAIIITSPDINHSIPDFFDKFIYNMIDYSVNVFYKKNSKSMNMNLKKSRSTEYRTDLRKIGKAFENAYDNKVFIIVLHDYDGEDEVILYKYSLKDTRIIEDLNDHFKKYNIMTKIIDHGINNDNNDIVNEFNEMGIFGVNIYIKNNTDERLQYIASSLVNYLTKILS
uniref:Uncharacterized protein n=1 Tax=Pithovirus LCPAC104 TaxID=2506589 RepID=A0A481Z3X7_9VIRU|nr:MAG: hypothetical protein LCPAC104_01040 [Pithovirus LCPAC104]